VTILALSAGVKAMGLMWFDFRGSHCHTTSRFHKGAGLNPSWLLQADHAQPTVQGLVAASNSMAVIT